MHYFSLDHWVVYAFLAITLAVGLWAGRGIKDIREYAIANRVYGTGVLTITFLATAIGGSTVIGTTGNVFKDGILSIIATDVSPLICILWMAFWFAPRMVHFEGCLTMGDIMGVLYGKHGQVATGVLGFFATICIVSGQVQSLAYVYEFILGLKSRQWAIGLGGFIAITYAALGGMKAVTITDVLQFVVLVIVVPMVAHVMTNEIGGIKALLSKVPTENLQMASHSKLGYYIPLMLFSCVFNPFFLAGPPFIARMLMARNKQEATHMLFIASAFCLFFSALITLIGLTAFVLYPTLAPDKIFPQAVHEFFPVGLRGLCAAGLIAVLMSTADSFLHAAGLSVVHDVIRPLRTTKFQELRWVKYCTFGIGCAAILLALRSYNVFSIVIYGINIIGATITVPFVAGVLGLKTDARSFKVALWGTIPVFIVTDLWFDPTIHHWAYPVSLMVNVLLFFGTHVLQNKGLIVEKYVGHQSVLGRLTWPRLSDWLPTPKKLLAYSHRKLSRYGYNSTLFALFLSLNYMVPFFMYSYSHPSTYGWTLAIKSISIFLCIGLLMKPYWPTRLLAYFPIYYHLTLLYCLPFTSAVMFLLTQGSVEWLINIAITIMFLIVLVDWVSFIILSLMGVALGFGFYHLAVGPITLQLDFSTAYLLVYTCVFSTIIALIFSRRKEQHLEAKFREISVHYYANRKGEATHPPPAVYRIAHMIERNVQEVTASYNTASHVKKQQLQPDENNHTAVDCLQYFFPTAIGVIQQGEQMMQHLGGVVKQDYIQPHLSNLLLKDCVDSVLKNYDNNQLDRIQKDYTEGGAVYASWKHLQYAIIHVLHFLQAHTSKTPILLWITPKKGINMRLAGKSVASSWIHELFTLFPAQETTHHLGLAISRLLIEAQGGRLLYETHALSTNPYTEFIISLPIADEVPDFR